MSTIIKKKLQTKVLQKILKTNDYFVIEFSLMKTNNMHVFKTNLSFTKDIYCPSKIKLFFSFIPFKTIFELEDQISKKNMNLISLVKIKFLTITFISIYKNIILKPEKVLVFLYELINITEVNKKNLYSV